MSFIIPLMANAWFFFSVCSHHELYLVFRDGTDRYYLLKILHLGINCKETQVC